MSDKNARTLTQPSNRAKPNDVKEKKVVFKSALASPFRVQWPSVPINLQNNVLAYIVQALEGASDYHSTRSALGRKRKQAAKATASSSQKNKKLKSEVETAENPENETTRLAVPDIIEANGPACQPLPNLDHRPNNGIHEPPIMLRHALFGINEVTKRLEIQTRNARRPVIVAVPEPPLTPPIPLKSIFVCRADVDLAILIDHIPHLVAAYNSSHPRECVKLVTLPRGSELVLAKTLGIRRVMVLGINKGFPEDQQLTSMLEKVPTLTASWLTNTKPSSALIATHVKHLRTTAPKDMKTAKELRTQQKADAKKKKLQKAVAR